METIRAKLKMKSVEWLVLSKENNQPKSRIEIPTRSHFGSIWEAQCLANWIPKQNKGKGVCVGAGVGAVMGEYQGNVSCFQISTSKWKGPSMHPRCFGTQGMCRWVSFPRWCVRAFLVGCPPFWLRRGFSVSRETGWLGVPCQLSSLNQRSVSHLVASFSRPMPLTGPWMHCSLSDVRFPTFKLDFPLFSVVTGEAVQR